MSQVLSPPAPDGRVFTGIHGGELASITYRRAWIKHDLPLCPRRIRLTAGPTGLRPAPRLRLDVA